MGLHWKSKQSQKNLLGKSTLTHQSGNLSPTVQYVGEEEVVVNLYVPVKTDPTQIKKINPNILSVVSTLTLSSGENGSYPILISDGKYLYAGLFTAPAKVVRIDLATFSRVDAITFASGENFVQDLEIQGDYLYAGLYTVPAKIVKVDLRTFTQVSTLTLLAGNFENYVQKKGLAISGNYMYASVLNQFTTTGRLVQIDLSTFTRVDYILNDFALGPLYVLGNYLYGGRTNSVRKLDLTTFSVIGTLTLSSPGTPVRDFVHSENYLYVSMGASPGKVEKVDLTTFAWVAAITFDTNQNEALGMDVDSKNLYVAVQWGFVKKIDLATFTVVGTLDVSYGVTNVEWSAIIA